MYEENNQPDDNAVYVVQEVESQYKINNTLRSIYKRYSTNPDDKFITLYKYSLTIIQMFSTKELAEEFIRINRSAYGKLIIQTGVKKDGR